MFEYAYNVSRKQEQEEQHILKTLIILQHVFYFSYRAKGHMSQSWQAFITFILYLHYNTYRQISVRPYGMN